MAERPKTKVLTAVGHGQPVPVQPVRDGAGGGVVLHGRRSDVDAVAAVNQLRTCTCTTVSTVGVRGRMGVRGSAAPHSG